MDDTSSRARPPARRMASARPTTSVRRGGTGTGGTDVAVVSPARWAGVVLVIAALVGAIVLAVVSPSQRTGAPGVAAGTDATPSPSPTPAGSDTRVPVEAPTIASPGDRMVTREWDLEVTVKVPKDPLRRRFLTLVVQLDGKEVASVPRPEPGKPVTTHLRLQPGANVITAALEGPGGLGPSSAPVTVHHDADAPELRITAPEGGSTVTEPSVVVVIASEPGVQLVVSNEARGWDIPYTVGPSGTIDPSVPLDMGRNRIVVSSTNEAGMKQQDAIVVHRKSGRPVIDLKVPKTVERRSLPERIRVVVTVTDVDGRAIEDAEVAFSLGSSDMTAEGVPGTTDAEGRAVWQVVIPAGVGQADPVVTVEVTAPNGEQRDAHAEIKIS